jgi:hypothetical protein
VQNFFSIHSAASESGTRRGLDLRPQFRLSRQPIFPVATFDASAAFVQLSGAVTNRVL